jgi:hypothetical protein
MDGFTACYCSMHPFYVSASAKISTMLLYESFLAFNRDLSGTGMALCGLFYGELYLLMSYACEVLP